MLAVFRVAAVLGCVFYSTLPGAMKIRQAAPEPWFSLSFELDTKGLPRGVGFKREDGYDGFYFTNSTSTPLYVARVQSAPPGWIKDLPPNVVPVYMAVSGTAFRMDRAGEWSRENAPGIALERLLPLPDRPLGKFAHATGMYLGSKRVSIRGSYAIEWSGPPTGSRSRVDRIHFDSPLPPPLRLDQSRGPLIINDGAIPFYAAAVYARPVGWAREVPPGHVAGQKIVSGNYRFPDWPYPETADGWKEGFSTHAMLTEETLAMYSAGFMPRQVRQDHRPADTRPPAAQPFAITLFYGPEKIIARGRVLYGLNPKYDPRAGQAAPMCMSCTGREMCDECARINKGPRR